MAAPPRRDHARNESAQAVHDAAEIHAEQPVVVLRGHGLDRAEAVDPGGIEQERHRLSEVILHAVRGRSVRLAIGDIEGNSERIDPLLAEFVDRSIDRVTANVGDRDPRPGTSEDTCLAEAGARGAAGDEGDPAGVVRHAASFAPDRSRSAPSTGRASHRERTVIM